MAFLSLLDDREKPKGSRDPLGFEMVWSHYGREVVGNLTTITSSISNFAVALLGFKWANELALHLPEHARHLEVRETFLRYEQLTGYLRYLAGDKALMGITRIGRRIEEPAGRVSFGLDTDQQILSDQASYGMWGLYSSAMRDTQLVHGDDRLLTALGMDIAAIIERKLDKDALIKLFRSKRKVRADELTSFAKPFLAAINQKRVRDRLLHALMNGNPHKRLQQEMWDVTQKLANADARIRGVADFIDQVARQTQEPTLQKCLIDIQQVERLLVASNNVFHYCRRKDGESVGNIVKELDQRYEYSHLPMNLDLSQVPRGERLREILDSFRAGNTAQAVQQILELNRIVMAQRGGAPWVEAESSKHLRVRVPSELAALKSQNELEKDWDYDYFLGSFIQIASDGLKAQWTAR
ncbi:hypothetical protein NOR53_2493 [gamma proteobacterium NOR5-3]|nr:hypothetical protein NOR53_2493 [gamma proteobacterium NOR5-3]